MNIEMTEYHGVPDCIRLSNGVVELVATTAFGPRILHCGLAGAANLFAVFEEDIAHWKSPATEVEQEWRSYGGHRLWHAPEVKPRTYIPDNVAVSHAWDDGRLVLGPVLEEENGLKKTVAVTLSENDSHVLIDHEISNQGPWEIELSAWCLSVMAPGGELTVPQEEYRAHPDYLAPARPVVVWHFTAMDDPRLEWGSRFIRMRQDDTHPTKVKFGTRNTKGWASYLLGDVLFVKQYPFSEDGVYPDMGCNCEFYTQPGFLEIETLSPVTKLKPGGTVTHRERWTLRRLEPDQRDTPMDEIVASLGVG
jgi:hypothetical protein